MKLLTKIVLLLSLFSVAFTQDIAFVGNSITASGYYQVVDDLMPRFTAHNFGIPGITVAVAGFDYKSTSEYQLILQLKPQCTVVLLGSNDWQVYSAHTNSWGDIWESEYRFLIDNFGKNSLVFLGTIPYRISSSEANIAIAGMNERIKKVAKEYGLQIIDFNSALGTDPAYFNADGIHPSYEGKLALGYTAYYVLEVTISNPAISTNIDNEVLLSWELNSEPWIDHYRILRGTGSGLNVLTTVSNGQFSYTDKNLISGIMYYYMITARDIDGIEWGRTEVLSIRVWSPPTSISFTVSIEEDGNYAFQSSDFSYNDADGHSFSEIMITTPPNQNQNTIQYSQSNLLIGTTISDISNLHFIPTPNEFGHPYVKFKYKVKDSSGDFSNSEYSATMTVTPKNDLPSNFILQTPTDNNSLVITISNLLNNYCEFTWTTSDDVDGDQVLYNFIATGALEFLSTQGLTEPTINFDHSFICDNIETESIVSGKWTVEATDGIGITPTESGEITFIIDATQMTADKFALDQNFPNPFNPITSISYGLKNNSDVLIDIYNLTGQHVITLVEEPQEKGIKVIQWQGVDKLGRQVDSGIYFYKLQAGDFIKTRKMALLK